ncbi:MAG: hypothetical protein WC375_10580, partial [Methanomassiliicoccales archaeon]
MISNDSSELTQCKNCLNKYARLNDEGLCKRCSEGYLVPMKCLENDCGHKWNHPGTGYICPLCGSARVTSDDGKINEWIMEAEKLGISFIGIQKGYGMIPNRP